MKKIINGKVYDTETAHRLAAWDNGIYGDINSLAETLCQKRTGEFFLHGDGGANTKYAVPCSGGWSGGSRIIPLTWDEASAWAEEHLPSEAYERIFGAVVEDDSRTVVTMSLSVGAVERAKRAAAQAGLSLSAYIESLIG